MEGHDGDDAEPNIVQPATRLITTTLDQYQGTADSDDEDDDDYVGEDDDGDDDEEYEAAYLLAAEVSDDEESSRSLEVQAMPGFDGGGVEALDHAIAHSTALGWSPSEGSLRLGRRKAGSAVNVMTMLKGREINVSRNGRFSRAECCHVSARFLPTDGPSVVDRLNSRAYIGQFSLDGTLFVAGFQVRSPPRGAFSDHFFAEPELCHAAWFPSNLCSACKFDFPV